MLEHYLVTSVALFMASEGDISTSHALA